MGWFGANWVWVGAVLACVLAVLLFFTDVLRSDVSKPRYKDLYWLGWACSFAYFIHNIEEYGVDLHGQSFGFPKTMVEFASNVVGIDMGAVSIPVAYFVAVNISMVWIAFPLLAAMGRKRPMASLILASALFVNGLMHATLWFAGTYTSGALTSVVLFLPITIWTFVLAIGKASGKFAVSTLLVSLLIGGVIMHAILIISSAAYVKAGAISFGTLVLIQVLNAVLLIALSWFVSGTRLGKTVPKGEVVSASRE